MEERYIVPLYSVVMLYILVAQFFALYFWYLYGKDHGFLASVFIGPIVGEFKGLLFPFFI
jgi:hypothetical protein